MVSSSVKTYPVFFDRAELGIEENGDESFRYEYLQSQTHRTGWLGMHMRTAVGRSRFSKSDREKANKIVVLGYRRYRNMLGDPSQHHLSHFGLLKPGIFNRIAILRKFANKEGLKGGKQVIRYRCANSTKVGCTKYEKQAFLLIPYRLCAHRRWKQL